LPDQSARLVVGGRPELSDRASSISSDMPYPLPGARAGGGKDVQRLWLQVRGAQIISRRREVAFPLAKAPGNGRRLNGARHNCSGLSACRSASMAEIIWPTCAKRAAAVAFRREPTHSVLNG